MVAGNASGVHRPHATEERREDWISDSLLSGFVATVVMSIALAATYGLANVLGDANGNRVERWLQALSHNRLTERAGEGLALAIGLNLVVGLVFALIYGAIEPSLPGQHGWEKGMVFSLFPWLLSIIAFFPVMDGGLLGRSLGAGPLPVIGNLILHLIYGAVLGWVYAIGLEEWLDGSDLDRRWALAQQKGATVGVIAGAVVGALAGWALSGQLADIMSQGLSIVLGALVVGAFGALIGSIVTGDRTSHPHAS